MLLLYWFGIWSLPFAFFSLSLFFFVCVFFYYSGLLFKNKQNKKPPSPPCITTLAFLEKQYRQALNKSTPLHLQQKQRSFLTFGFGASGGSSVGGSSSTGTERSSLAVGGGVPPRRESNINVNVTPTSHDAVPDTPEIRKYKKRFNSEVLCASLWGLLTFWDSKKRQFNLIVIFY